MNRRIGCVNRRRIQPSQGTMPRRGPPNAEMSLKEFIKIHHIDPEPSIRKAIAVAGGPGQVLCRRYSLQKERFFRYAYNADRDKMATCHAKCTATEQELLGLAMDPEQECGMLLIDPRSLTGENHDSEGATIALADAVKGCFDCRETLMETMRCLRN